jgi:hypothetical protein
MSNAPLLFKIAGSVFALLPIGHTQMARDVLYPGLRALGGSPAAYPFSCHQLYMVRAPEKVFFQKNTKTSNSCLHVNKVIKTNFNIKLHYNYNNKAYNF